MYGSTLVQVMACRQFGAKPWPRPMLTYCHLDSLKQSSVKFEAKYKTFHSRKCILKCRIGNCSHFVQGKISLLLISIAGRSQVMTKSQNCQCFRDAIDLWETWTYKTRYNEGTYVSIIIRIYRTVLNWRKPMNSVKSTIQSSNEFINYAMKL